MFVILGTTLYPTLSYFAVSFKAVALDPEFSKKSTKPFVTGGDKVIKFLAGSLLLDCFEVFGFGSTLNMMCILFFSWYFTRKVSFVTNQQCCMVVKEQLVLYDGSRVILPGRMIWYVHKDWLCCAPLILITCMFYNILY